MEPKQFIQVANSYIEHGFSVIPVGADKKPLIKWEQYQNRRATPEEIERWSKFKNPNIAIVTGSISGIVVVDVEAGGPTDGLPPTVIAKTGGGGWHFYYMHPGYEFKNSARKLRELTDVRGDGGYVIAPPSLHKSGRHYEWSVSPDAADFDDVPGWILQSLVPAKAEIHEVNDWEKLLAQDNHEGTRNDMSARVAGFLLASINPAQWETVGWFAFTSWNTNHNKPSLNQKELKSVWDSIKGRTSKKSSGAAKNLVPMIVQDIEASKAKLFHDQQNDAYIAYNGDGSSVNKLNSKPSKQWLTHHVWQAHKTVLKQDNTNQVLQTLASAALYDGPEIKLSIRCAYNDDGLWYYLGDGRAVHITQEGWSTTETPPIVFKRFSSQKSQVLPADNGNIELLFEHINLTNEHERLLLLAFVVAAFIPDFPHPLLVLHGPQGSAKSTTLEMLQRLIDPASIRGLPTPKNPEAFVQTASHHSFLFYDNLSTMPLWFSDALARASTGDSFAKRELWTDDDDVIYNLQKTIALNSIDQVISKPDLLQRSILLNLEPITPARRKEYSVLWKEFERDRPLILGGIFDVLSKALSIYPSAPQNNLSRMADFTRWGYAIAEAIGSSGQAFIEAYRRNTAVQHDEAIEANPVAQAILVFMEDRNAPWSGTASELFALLSPIVFKLNLSGSKRWPKDAAWLGRGLTAVQSDLAAKGIEIEHSRAKERLITISKNAVVTVDTDAPDDSLTDDDDSTTATTVQRELL